MKATARFQRNMAAPMEQFMEMRPHHAEGFDTGGAAGKTVAVVGLGSMGYAIACRLMSAGLSVVGHDISKVAADRFVEAGGHLGDLPSVLRDSDVVILSLLDELQIRSVLYDETGSLHPLKAGAVVVCTSTVSVDFVVACDADLAARRVGFLDAPVSGGPVRAAAGELATYVAGAPDVIEQAMFVLSNIAKPLLLMGAQIGRGTSMKLINQLLVTGNLVVACQAAAFAQRAGLDMAQVIEAMNGSAGDSWILQNVLPRHVSGDYEPRATLALYMKDVAIIQKVSAERHIYNPVIDFVSALMSEAAQDGGKMRDGVIIAKYLTEHSAHP